jgi:hypothetical protein
MSKSNVTAFLTSRNLMWRQAKPGNLGEVSIK